MKNKFCLIAIMLISVMLISSALCAEESKTDTAAPAVPGKTPVPAATVPEPVSQAQAQAAAPKAEEVKKVDEGPSIEPGNVTVNFKGADIKTVLAYISEVAGVDIVPAPDVKCEVDLKLSNKPWKTALDIIVRNYGFAYEREGDIIRVVTLSKLQQEELATQSFTLNYSKSKDVVASVKDIVTARGKVMYDERTNTVLVTDIPTNIYKIGQIIARLDKRTEQVLIEARILETVLGADEKLGIDWNIKITASGAKRPTTFPFDYYDVGSKYLDKYTPLVQDGVSNVVPGVPPAPNIEVAPGLFPSGAVGTGSGAKGFPYLDYTVETMKNAFTFGTLDFSEFQAVLEMLKQRSDTDIISNPRIATLNNTPAMINVGQTLNMPTYERNGTTGKMEITGYNAMDLGINLQVTPHVNDNGEITIDLAPVISDLLRYDTLDRAAGIVAPVFSVRQAKTQIMIKDGQTIFIGGLIKENDIDVDKKVPFIGDLLGDVPYLGLLVSRKETRKQKTELIFFITVNLMSSDKRIMNIPDSNKAYVPMYSANVGAENKTKKNPKKNPKKMLWW